MKRYQLFIFGLLCLYLAACTSQKTLYKNNEFYFIEKNTGGGTITYTKYKCSPNVRTLATLDEKADYVVVETNPYNVTKTAIKSNYTDIPDADLAKIGKFFFPGEEGDESLRYFDVKLGLQAMTIPLKFRKPVGEGILNPRTVEAGVNVGFAPGWKFTHNVHKKTKNYLGKNTSQYAIALGPLFGLGTTELKKASNAPGIASDRRSAIFSWGGYVLLGFNNVNIGFAIGADNILGQKQSQWVYESKAWTGIIVSLDILKY